MVQEPRVQLGVKGDKNVVVPITYVECDYVTYFLWSLKTNTLKIEVFTHYFEGFARNTFTYKF